MRPVSILALLAIAACTTPETNNGSELSVPGMGQSLEELAPAPGILSSTSDAVHGVGCALPTEDWLEGDRLEGAWSAVGRVEVDGQSFESAAAFRTFLGSAPADQRELATLALNVRLNEAGGFGVHAKLQDAQMAIGPLAGVKASTIASMGSSLGTDGANAAREINEGFETCAPALFSDADDTDQDGVPDISDCDPHNPGVGAVLYDSELDSDEGYFTSPDPLSENNWGYDGSAYATGGGQEGQLGSESWDDVVIYTDVGARGTKVDCGFDCAEVCGEYVPDVCYEAWDAYALGILEVVAGNGGELIIVNNGDYDVCLHEATLWDGPATQALTMGSQDLTFGSELGGADIVIAPGESMSTYYGSWTTGAVGSQEGAAPWWCYQQGTYFDAGTEYVMLGATTPEDFVEIISQPSDMDGDGVEDHVDPSGHSVQTQQNLWDYQATHAAIIIGKTVTPAPGVATVSLSVENRGAVDAAGVLVTDTVPADWSVLDCDLPATQTALPSGETELTWSFGLDGCESGCSVVDVQEITCNLQYNLPVDLDHTIFGRATAAYFDGDDNEVSESLPGALFNYDYDGDGEILCGQTERWRVGVLARGDFDADQDEGYHGYRCAVARNPDEGCATPGYFLQIGEFADRPEDDISSECDGIDCPVNSTFDQLARSDHGLPADLPAGDFVSLAFYAVDGDLFCELTTEEGSITASATDYSFEDGATGMSTLNAFGDYEYIRVCEAFSVPE